MTTEEQRREAIEELIRAAARWGYAMAKLGCPYPPEPRVDWEPKGPRIRSVA